MWDSETTLSTLSRRASALALRRPRRLSALRSAGLLDTPPEEAFDRLTSLVCQLLGVPVALVTLVAEERQFFKSQQGLAEPWATRRETPLSHSFCQYIVVSEAPLSVADARQNPVLQSNGAVEDLGVTAYLGVPLRDADGYVLGAVCAIDSEPHAWTSADIETMEGVASFVTTELSLRAALRKARSAADELRVLNADLEARVSERTREVVELAHALTTAEENERSRLARILHDDLQQVLYGARLCLSDNAATDADSARAGELLADAAAIARDLSHDLVTPIPVEADLKEALTALAEQARERHGLDVAVEVEEVLSLPSGPMRILIGHIVKELLFNVSKHAGVEHARLIGRPCDGSLVIVVEDEGVGFDPEATGGSGGMRAVQKRTHLAGGSVAVESAPGEGTRVIVALALESAGGSPTG